MTRRTAVLTVIAVLMLSLLAGCGQKPDQTAIEFMKAIKAGDYAAANKLSATDISDLSEGDQESPEVVKALMDRLTYSVLVPEIKGDAGSVYVQLTSVDMSWILSEYMREAMALMMNSSGEPLTQEELDQKLETMLVEKVKSPSAKMVTTKAEMPLRKIDGQWKVSFDEDSSMKFADALLGGFISEFAELNPGGE